MAALCRWGALILPLVFLLMSGSVQAETLPEAIQKLLHTHPDIRAAVHNRRAREQEVRQALAGFYPSVDFVLRYGFEDRIEPNDTWSNPNSYSIVASYNIFRGFETTNELARQRARVRSMAYRLQGISETTTLRGARHYINVLRHRELHDLAKENLTIHQRIFDQVKLRSESGVDRKADLDHVKGRLALAQSNIVVTRVNVIDAETNFQSTFGYLPGELIRPTGIDSALPDAMEEAVALAVAGYPTLKSARSDLEARQAQYRVAQSVYYPIVDFSLEHLWEDDVDNVPYWSDETIGMITLRYNLFNGYQDNARVLETEQLISEAREIMYNTRRQTVESVRLSWMAYEAVTNQLVHLKEYVQSTEATAEAYAKQWNIGKRTMLDVLDVQAELINARKDLISAKYDNLDAQFRILSGMGKLVHTLGLEWPAAARIDDETAAPMRNAES